MTYIQYFTFKKNSMIIVYFSPIKHLNSGYQVKSNTQVFKKNMCYRGANENKTFSSYCSQENNSNIVLELLKPGPGIPLEIYSIILSVILVIPKAVIQK